MSESFALDKVRTAIVFGAGHGIGLALVKALLTRRTEIQLSATYRVAEKARELIELQVNYPERLQVFQLDPLDENQLLSLSEKLKQSHSCIDLILNCIGALDGGGLKPERKLADINLDSLSKAFSVNSIVTPLIAKYFSSLQRCDYLTCFAVLSAKVGSIEDNRLGGWYAYRASKAALNMFLRNIAIELKRNRQKTMCFAIHPGTTITDLSRPYIENTKYKLHSAEETAINILKQIEAKKLEDSGQFLAWDGTILPW